MRWRNRSTEPTEPQQGPRLSPEHVARIVAAHRLVIEAEQDAIAARIRERLGITARPNPLPMR